MTEKVTTMVLKVDGLQCPGSYKKVKKLLCKFPQIRDQVYDENKNSVTITVVCCSPERIRDKLCCKGRKFINSIEIKEPAAPKPQPDDQPPEQPKKTQAEKPEPHVLVPTPGYRMIYPAGVYSGPCYEVYAGGPVPCYYGYGRPVAHCGCGCGGYRVCCAENSPGCTII